MSLYDEYESYVKKYKAEYGERTVVLYRCGQFYELYSADDGLIDLKSISELLNIQVSRRNKAILEVDRSNTMMAGFPMFALRKFVSLLVNANYTVVIVDQITPPPKPKRAVTEIISPGTNLECIDIDETNNLVSIFIDEQRQHGTSKKYIYAIGIAIIDLSTGTSKVVESFSETYDITLPFDETYKILSTHSPKEILLFGNISQISYDEICSKLDINHVYIHNKLNIFPNDICSLSYQECVLQKVFPNYGLLTVIEHLDLERKPYATASYVYMLQFAMKHNETILDTIEKPIHIEKTKYCALQYNAAKQLNIISSSDPKQSLLHILNNCVTAIGRRIFKDVLLNPIIDSHELNTRYSIVDTFLTDHTFQDFRMYLKKTYDIERLLRKMVIGRMQPADFIQVDESIRALNDLYEQHQNMILKTFSKYDIAFFNTCQDVQKYYQNVFDMSEIAKYHLDNIDTSFLKVGINPEIDDIQSKIDEQKNCINMILKELNTDNDGYFKYDMNERDGIYFTITQKRFNDLKSTLITKVVNINDISFTCRDIQATPVSASSSTMKIKHPFIQKITDMILQLQNKLKVLVTNFFKTFVKEFISKCHISLQEIAQCIGTIDVYSNHAYNAFTYRYSKPTIYSDDNNGSYMDMKDVRHPIIERIQQNIQYVTNDISLDDKTSGLLLFGLNCSGKTSLSKAIALNIIMAQCGSFVPSRLTYAPFHNIFTRIPSGDDIFKGMSTFAVEMSELRNILKRADEYSCIVGDEISHGTEVVSGVAIVSAALLELSKKKSKFIFATHLHTIVDIPQISFLEQTQKIAMKHLQVYYDEKEDKLIYDRKLKDGPGSSMYGIEVCKSLDMPSDFIRIANNIRQQQMGIETNIVSLNKSPYNSKVYYDICTICGKKGSEIHHIRHQAEANADGFIDTIHKNDENNLMSVCDRCHDDIHANKISISGYIQTSKGRELQWHRNDEGSDITEEHTLEQQVLEKRKRGLSIAAISKELQISQYKVKQLLI